MRHPCLSGLLVSFMKHYFTSRFLPFIVALFVFHGTASCLQAEESPAASSENLAVLWTSGDPEVAHRVAFLYTLTAKKEEWFKGVTLIVWGPSQRLLAADKEIQAYVKKMQEAGVVVEACVNCAEAYGITEEIKALGIEVKPMGVPLTRFLKDPEWETLSF